jgi:hypothetical protein
MEGMTAEQMALVAHFLETNRDRFATSIATISGVWHTTADALADQIVEVARMAADVAELEAARR